jgi:hypothetical protein
VYSFGVYIKKKGHGLFYPVHPPAIAKQTYILGDYDCPTGAIALEIFGKTRIDPLKWLIKKGKLFSHLSGFIIIFWTKDQADNR